MLKITSILTLAKPAWRAVSYACRASGNAVPAAKNFQISVVEGLHAEAEAIAAEPSEGSEFGTLGRFRIGFQANLRLRHEAKGCRRSGQETL